MVGMPAPARVDPDDLIIGGNDAEFLRKELSPRHDAGQGDTDPVTVIRMNGMKKHLGRHAILRQFGIKAIDIGKAFIGVERGGRDIPIPDAAGACRRAQGPDAIGIRHGTLLLPPPARGR